MQLEALRLRLQAAFDALLPPGGGGGWAFVKTSCRSPKDAPAAQVRAGCHASLDVSVFE
jgi:hypothetical protein